MFTLRNSCAGLLLFFALLFLVVSCSRLQQPAALDRLTPCPAAEGPTDAYCGTYQVWEDRSARAGRRIALKIVLLPALKQKYSPDPLFVLTGGPGEAAAESAAEADDLFRTIRLQRDIVLIDQRGTGKSNPLDCPLARDPAVRASPAAFLDRMRACLESCKGKADLTKYTTEIAMDDLDEVRQFLGYSKINLYGVSYGTRAAIVYARRHPDHVRAVVLDSVSPPNFHLGLYLARDGQRALDLLFRDCEKEVGCREHFPNLRQRLETLLARIDANPQHIHYQDPHTGLERELDVKRLTLTSILFASLESPQAAATVPLLIEQAEKGDFSGFLALRDALEASAGKLAMGTFYSVICSEDAFQIQPDAIRRESAGTFFGPELAQMRLKPCEFWPHAEIDPGYFANTPSDIPALILSGELDPITPPSWGAQVASYWRNSRHVVIPGAAHRAISAGGVLNLIRAFLDRGSATDLDVSFTQHLKRPAFFISPSGPKTVAVIDK